MKKRGKGAALMQFTCGAVGAGNATGAFIKINEDSSVIVMVGTADIGQGSTMAFVQIAAETLGIPEEKIGIMAADTLATPYDSGATASRGIYFSGRAVAQAARNVLDILLDVAEKELKVGKDSLVVKDGRIFMDGYPTLNISFEDVVSKSYKNGIPPMSSASNVRSTTPLNSEGQGKPFEVYLYASQVAEVEVDTETGVVEVLKIYAAHDCGTAINPGMAVGQVYGGIHMGLGYALMEEMLWNEEGRLINPQLTDYMIPTTLDMPEIVCDLIEDDDPRGPFGAKGIGEPALMPTAPAIANAIYNAVGVRIYSLPITPEKVFQAIKEKENSKEMV